MQDLNIFKCVIEGSSSEQGVSIFINLIHESFDTVLICSRDITKITPKNPSNAPWKAKENMREKFTNS